MHAPSYIKYTQKMWENSTWQMYMKYKQKFTHTRKHTHKTEQQKSRKENWSSFHSQLCYPQKHMNFFTIRLKYYAAMWSYIEK